MSQRAASRARFKRLIAKVPQRHLSTDVLHYSPPGVDPLRLTTPSPNAGRCHEKGGAGAWYASQDRPAIEAEIGRFSIDAPALLGYLNFEVSVVHFDGDVLVLTGPDQLAIIGVTVADMIDDDRRIPQDIAQAARDAGVSSMLIPSAALPGAATLVVLEVVTGRLSVISTAGLRIP